jgi:hypothetical protein
METANGPPLESEYAEKKYHYYICDRSDPRLSTDYLGAIVAEKNGAKCQMASIWASLAEL